MSSRTQPYLPPNTAPPTTTYQYDALGRTTKITLPDGGATQYTYQGNVTTVTDPAGNWKQYTNDAFGNLVTVLEPNPAAPGVPPIPSTSQYPLTPTTAPPNTLFTGYTYDQLNHLTQVTMPRTIGTSTVTQTRKFNYDATTQLLTSAFNPENGTISYVYNGDSTLQTKTYNNGNCEKYSYDTYQRLTEIQRFPGSPTCATGAEDTTQQQLYTYGTTSYNGLLTAATFASGQGPNNWTLQNQYTYLLSGQVATKALSVSNPTTKASGLLTTTYGYDGLGTLTSIQYPNSITLTYALDSLERPTGLTDSNNYTWASGVQYNPANQITNATFPSGTQTWVYNTLLQLTQRTTTSGSTTRMNMTYNYTAGKDNGQIASSADAVTGETITYTYDSLKRLINASSSPLPPVNAASWSGAYTYDGFGNLTNMTPGGLSVTVNSATNQIQPTNIAYDGNGNVTQFGPSGSLKTLGYDVANRLATVNTNSAYAYDSANQRVYYRNSAGAETLYIYGTAGQKLATYTITGTNPVAFTLQSENVYFAGKLISAEGNTAGGNAVTVDGLGSMRWSAATGAHTYFPYGIEYYTDKTTATDTENYATYTEDSLTGLDYAMNRYYASFWARFLTPDPSPASIDVGNPLSWNRYMYTLGDPVAGSDPSGLEECAGDGGGGEDPGEDSDDVVRRRTGPHALCSAEGGGGGGGPAPDPDPNPDPAQLGQTPCPAGQSFVSGNCLPTEAAPTACPAGQTLINGTCNNQAPQLVGPQPGSVGQQTLNWIQNGIVWFYCGSSPSGAILNWMETGATKGGLAGAFVGGGAGGAATFGVGGVPGAIVGGIVGGVVGAGGGVLVGGAAAGVCSAAGAYGGG